MSKKFGVNQAKINNTCFKKCHLGQNRKMNICELFFNMARKDFDIFVEDMTQKIHENYLGILGVTKIYVASQPMVLRVIPLSEKEYSQQKNFWIRSRMEMT